MGFLLRKQRKHPGNEISKEFLYYKEDGENQWAPPSESLYSQEIIDYMTSIYPDLVQKASTFHEIISNTVLISIHVLPPNEERDFYVLYTTGMSNSAMNIPNELKGECNNERVELIMYLPSDWKGLLELSDTHQEISGQYYWPIEWLKYLAHFPHEYQTWFNVGHTIPNGPDYEPLGDGTKLNSFLFSSPFQVPPLTSQDGTLITFLWPIPMYREEIEYKLKFGLEETLLLMDRAHLSLTLNPRRRKIL